MISDISASPTAESILEMYEPEILIDSSKGAYYDPNTNTIYLFTGNSREEAVESLSHELGHIFQIRNKINWPNVRETSRSDYIDGRIMNEVMADVVRYTVFAELGKNTSIMAKPSGQDKWESTPASQRVQFVKDRYIGSSAVYKGSKSGLTYDDAAGKFWDKFNK